MPRVLSIASQQLSNCGRGTYQHLGTNLHLSATLVPKRRPRHRMISDSWGKLLRCGSYAVSQVLVGLHRVGLVGLRQACAKGVAAGLTERDEIVELLLAELAADNFIPDAQRDDYRIALWREYLRSVGEDFSEFFSEIEVTLRGEASEDRDLLAGLCASVLADFELRPLVEFEVADNQDPKPQLVIGDALVASGLPSRKVLKAIIRHRLSDW